MILEIRTYRLLPGTGEDFVQVMRDEAMPLLAEFGIQVVDCGLSIVREDGFEEALLVRAFDSIEHRDAQEEAFYSSEAWHSGPRHGIISRIETYHTIVIETSPELVRAWQR
jgi:hypothetical protein